VNEVNLSDVKGAVRLSGEFHENVSLARIAKSVSFKTSRTDPRVVQRSGKPWRLTAAICTAPP